MSQIPLVFSIQPSSVLIWLTALIIISMGLVILWGSRSLASKAFAVLMFCVFSWMIAMGFFDSAVGVPLAAVIAKATYFFGGTTAAAFFYFALVFPEGTRPKRNKLIVSLLIISQLFLLGMYLFTNSITYGAVFIGGYQPWAWYYGKLSFIFDIFFDSYWGLGLAILFWKYLKETGDAVMKTRLRYMLISLIIGVIPPSVMCIILPRFGYFSLDWAGVVSAIGYVAVVSYSIAEYNQMDVKAVASEVLVFVVVVVLFVNIFTSGSVFGTYGRVGIFIAFVIVGYYLIRSIIRENKQREELALLNDKLKDFNEHLEKKVDEQTREIKNSYELEREARLKLEQLYKNKDQFVLAIESRLRAPLTTLKGYLKPLLGSKDSIGQVRPVLEKADLVADELSSLVNELLDISEMEVRKNISRDASSEKAG